MLELTCYECGKTKPAKQFRADKKSKLRDEQGCGRRKVCYQCLYQRYKEQAKLRSKRWYAANKELSARKAQQWKERNRESYRRYQREYHRQWGRANPDKIRAYQARRRQQNPPDCSGGS